MKNKILIENSGDTSTIITKGEWKGTEMIDTLLSATMCVMEKAASDGEIPINMIRDAAILSIQMRFKDEKEKDS